MRKRNKINDIRKHKHGLMSIRWKNGERTTEKKNNKNTHASILVVVDEEISGNVTIQIVAVLFCHIMCDDKKKTNDENRKSSVLNETRF